MRFLNKVFFINSATIPFAEVMVDGNVHLIGTQGVGKSTLLRAILFFYNADTLKLGISKEKKTFADYYFPYRNSYLVYEVMRETGPYCILAIKSQGKVCFRFIDSAFDKTFFISADGLAFEKWEDTRQMLDAGRLSYSNKIERYEEYRNILYGNPELVKRDLTRFSLLQSRQYQNIPRTIQNVFLNSKLDAGFIKQTIIMSLNEEDIVIDLTIYTNHLKNFERQVSDIQRYKLPEVKKTAEDAVNRLLAIRFLEKEKNLLSLQLAWSAAAITRKLPGLQQSYNASIAETEKLNQSVALANSKFHNKSGKIRDEISVMEYDLKKAKEKSDYYTKLNIGQLLAMEETKGSLRARLDELIRERQLLTSQFGEIAQKYEAIRQSLQHRLREAEHEKSQERLKTIEQAHQEEKQARKLFDDIVTRLRTGATEAIAQERERLSDHRQTVTDLKLQRESAIHRVYLESEKRQVYQQLQDLQLSIASGNQELINLGHQQQNLQKQGEIEEAGIKLEATNTRDKLQAKTDQLKFELTGLENKLNNEDSLYVWLNSNKRGWQTNIGKVATDEVLFSHSLNPVLSTAGNINGDDLFGVKLDLREIESRAKTVAEYEEDRIALQSRFDQHVKELHSAQQDEQEKLEKLKRKIQPQLRSLKDEITATRYKLEREMGQLAQATLFSKEVEIKAAAQKKEAIAALDSGISDAAESLAKSELELERLEADLTRQLKSKEREFNKRIQAIAQASDEQVGQAGQKIRELQKHYELEKDALESRQQNELLGQGVDTNRLKEIASLAAQLERDLGLIEKNRDIVTEYKKDKREYIDRTDDFKSQKSLLEKQLETELAKYNLQQQQFQKELAALTETAENLKDQLREAAADIAAFENFTLSDVYAAIDPVYKVEQDIYETEKNCRALIDALNNANYTTITKLEELKANINRFSGNFSPENIFNFKTSFISNQDYIDFADQLNEFVQNSKIGEYEKRVNERFSNIISTVGNQTGSLMSKAGEIQRVITLINSDFQNKNFVGAIRKIELKLDESANRVVQMLREIKKFNDDHSFDLGGMNLFSTTDSLQKNQKAADLLRNFGKAMSDFKLETISLSDSFELKFRIEENDNDTGWVEKLSNVGSEGTDVLVKAMINIMLLNVFKDAASRKFKDFRLHCMMDEIGKLHPNNVRGILQFANDRNINLINGSPTENNALDYRHIYKLEKDSNRHTRIKRIISKTG